MVSMAPSKVSLKLLIDKNGRRVLFAEAGKDFVDFLFSILSLPISTVITLLTKTEMVGCLANLYHSVEDLKDEYMQPNTNPKETLLKPKSSTSVPLLQLNDAPSSSAYVPRSVATTFYKCRGCSTLFTYRDSECWRCYHQHTEAVTHYVPEKEPAPVVNAKEGGFVKAVVTYMVMDDLTVTPMSSISSITLLNKFNVKEVGALEEKVVEIGIDQGLGLLKNALTSNMVLTNVFLRETGKTKAKAGVEIGFN